LQQHHVNMIIGLINLDSIIDKYQTGVLSTTTCGSTTDAASVTGR